ncbi:hypothetical protein J0H58_07915 [bacterium]|nr:hypothetical protein [bacterium]
MAGKKQVRTAFRATVFRRDRYHCAACGKPGRDRQGGDAHRAFHPGTPDDQLVPLDAHHITDRNQMPGGGYVLENGIALCDDGCHRLAEVFHQTGTAHPGFAPDDLYARVDSSFEAARHASESLE